jgi:acyl-CoA synthetase (AMP-forming)/AMP-acid ligase II
MVLNHPFRSVVEIDAKEHARVLPVARIWRTAQALMHALAAAPSAGRPPLVLCLDSFLDLTAAGWAAAALDRDCHFWHLIDGHESSRDPAGQWRGLQAMLGPCQLVTRSRLLREFAVDWESEECAPVRLDRLAADPAGFAGEMVRDGHRGRILVKTSGTTGTGRLAVLPYAVQLARIRSARLAKRNHISLSALPMDNITGLSHLVPDAKLRVLISPSAVAIDPMSLFRAIERFGVQEFSVSSSLALRLLGVLRRSDVSPDLSSLRHLGVGLEPVDPGTILQLLEELAARGAADVRVSCGYGLTEVGRVAFTPDLAPAGLRALAGVAGGAVPMASCAAGREIRIADEEGRMLEEGREGEIQIRAPQRTIDGYIDERGNRLPVCQVDGWVCSGDIGRIDDRGLAIVGRSKGIIFSNGKCIALDPVEQALRDAGVVRDGLVAAVPLEGPAQAADYVVFFSAPAGNAGAGLLERVRQLATSAVGIRPARVVALPAERFAFTPTGKLRKRHLGQLYGDPESPPQALPPPGQTGGSEPQDPLFARLRGVWNSVLGLGAEDASDGTFFELGGSSIAAVEFLHRAEQEMQVRLPVERFFSSPTLQAVWRMFLLARRDDFDEPAAAVHCLDRIQAHVRGWRGCRLSAGSFLRGFHDGGTRIPIFWVFQMEAEMLSLAGALGGDQPLHGMRSLHNVVRISELADPVLREVSNQYMAELLAITRGRPFVLGGNCQGAIVALRMAQALEQLGCAPAMLFLMEWTFAWGRYGKPVTVLYGNRSRSAQVYASEDGCGLPWTHDLPRAVVRHIEGAHGEFFQPPNVASLAERLLEATAAG